LAASFGAVGAAISIGAAVAENQIDNSVEAFIINADNMVTSTDGDITIEAVENATITAVSSAASASVRVGGLGVAISGAGADATNVILTDTNAFVMDSKLSSDDEVKLDADNSSTINATVVTASASAVVGAAGVGASIGTSVARNLIGWDLDGNRVPTEVQAYVERSSIDAGGALTLDATAVENIDATVVAGSVAVAAGGLAVAVSGAGASTKNRVANRVRAYVKDATGTGIRVGSGSLQAYDTTTIQANVEAASIAGAVGVIGVSAAIGVAIADNHISNEVEAFVSSSTLETTSGDLTIEAVENASISGLSIAAAAAGSASIFSVSVSGGGAEATNTIDTRTLAYVSQSSLDISGDLDVHASDTSSSTAVTGSSSVAAGLISVALGGSIANGTITSTTEAYIDNSNVSAGDIVVNATAQPKAQVDVYGVNAGTLAVGVSKATSTVSPNVKAFVGGSGKTITADSLTVKATQLLPTSGYSGKAGTTGSAGGLIGIDATISNVTNNSNVASYVKDGTTLNIAGGAVISAANNTRQKAVANSNTAGLIAAGISSSNATSNTSTMAYLGSSVKLTGGTLAITATGHDDNFADTVAGSAGAIAVSSATAKTTTNSTTIAEVRDGVAGRTIDLTGAFQMAADHTAKFNGRVKAKAGGLFAGAGAEIDNTVTSYVAANVGNNVAVHAKSIVIDAVNHARKPWLSSANIEGEAGGFIAGGGAYSDTLINFTTLVSIGDGASLEVWGKPSDPGAFRLRALNDIFARDKITFTSGGAVSGLGAYSTIKTTKDLARVQVGDADLRSVGAVDISARGTGDVVIKINAEAYGIGTVIVGESVAELSPVNEVDIGAGAFIHADGDLNISTGTSVDFARDQYTLETRMDTFAGSAIPIEDIDATSNLIQNNTIIIGAGALLKTARDARLHAERDGYANMMAKAKAVNWVSETFGAGNSEEMYNGSVHTDAHATVQVDGTIRTGIKRQQSLVLNTWDKSSGTITGFTKTDGVEFSVSQEILKTTLQKELETAKAELLKYQDTNESLKTFYEKEIARIEQELAADGLLETNPDGSSSRVEQYVMTVSVDPIWAQAGTIDVRSDQLQGSGTFDAPGDASVTIFNHTPAFLNLYGITIPETNGGLFFKGVEVPNNAEINDLNTPDEGVTLGVASFAGVPDSTTSSLPKIEVENDFDPRLITTGDIYPWPDITVLGEIDNLQGDLFLKTHPQGKGDIMISARVRAKNVSVVAGGNVFIDGVTSYAVKGEPYSIWNSVTGGDGTASASDTGVNNLLSQIPSEVSLFGDRIFINAEYLNINGIMQSGKSDYVLNMGSETINEINAIKNSSQRGLVYLPSASSSDFLVRFDTATEQIVVDELRVSGGFIDLTGHILNTGNGEIRVLGGYGNIEITNETPYDLVLNRLDASNRGAGVLVIKDKAKGIPDNPLATIYEGGQYDWEQFYLSTERRLAGRLGGGQDYQNCDHYHLRDKRLAWH
jgi:hypothetical protein